MLFRSEKDLEWDDADVEGQFRFLQRIWRLVDAALARGLSLAAGAAGADSPSPELGLSDLSGAERDLRRSVHTAIAAISEDLSGDYQFNTAVSELMKLSNAMAEHLEGVADPVAREALASLLLLLAPFAPHLAEELWQKLGGTGSIHRLRWPQADSTALQRDTIPLVIQIKGKVRGQLEVPADADKATLERLALTSEVAERWLEGKAPSRVIVVPGKLVNLVP